VVTPVDTPVKIPLAEPIVPTLVVLLVHTPPEGDDVKVTGAPVHTGPGTPIAAGAGFTVDKLLAGLAPVHPLASV
jgi:hypothetical protein